MGGETPSMFGMDVLT